MKKWMSIITLIVAFAALACSEDVDNVPIDDISTNAAFQDLDTETLSRIPCVAKTMKRLGINISMKTSPELINEILTDDMLLNDLPAVTALLGKSLTEPVYLWPMLLEISSALITKQPAVSEFLCEALDADLIPRIKKNDPDNKVIKRVIHHTYILNKLTLEMANSYEFHFALQNHLFAKRAEYGIRPDLVGALEDLKVLYGGEMFGPTKVVGVDLTNGLMIQLRAAGVVPPEAAVKLAGSVKLNILEAGVTENMAGYNDNAMAAAVLAAIPPKSITIQEGTRNTQWDWSQQWNSLYESWNFAFITQHATYPAIYYPKLLIPAVIGADNKTYLANRAMSLWLSLFFRQFAALNGKPDVRIPNSEELTALWSSINYDYAEQLAIDETGYPIEAFAPALNITLARSWRS